MGETTQETVTAETGEEASEEQGETEETASEESASEETQEAAEETEEAVSEETQEAAEETEEIASDETQEAADEMEESASEELQEAAEEETEETASEETQEAAEEETEESASEELQEEAAEETNAIVSEEEAEAEEIQDIVYQAAAEMVDGDWTYSVENGTAVIAKYKGTDAAVTVPTSVVLEGKTYLLREIGSKAFEGNQTMTSVVIPAEITKIGPGAFKNCTALSSVTINGDIADCHNYTLNTYDNRDLNYGVFVGAGTNSTSLKVTFGPEVTRIPARLFATARDKGNNTYAHITELVIGDKVTEIGDAAFARCFGLKQITMGSGAMSIGYQAFYMNTGLTTLTLGSGTRSVGKEAFIGCTALETLNCSEKLDSIGEGAFAGCSFLKNITFNSALTAIGYQAFRDCVALTTLVIPQSVTSIGGGAFKNCTSLSDLTINGDIKDCHDYTLNTYEGRDLNYGVFVSAGSNASSFKVTFGPEVTRIPARLFATAREKGNNTYANVTELVIGDKVTEIGDAAFARCFGLKQITMGSGAMSIGYQAFYMNTGLTTLTLGSGTRSVGKEAFIGCTALETLNCGEKLDSIGEGAFAGCSLLKNIAFNSALTAIGYQAFRDCVALTTLVIPQSVTSIGGGAFKNCTSLSDVTINGDIKDCHDYTLNTYDGRDLNYGVFLNAGSNASSFKVTFGPEVTRIPARLFATARDKGNNTYANVTELVIGDKVTEIGDAAFARCFGLKQITMGSGAMSIGYQAFYMNTGLTTLTLGSGTRSVGKEAFIGCTALETLNCGEKLDSIGESAFAGCSLLKNITFNSALTAIGYQAFRDCVALTTLVIPQSVTSIGGGAFKNCTDLSDVTINGDIKDCHDYTLNTYDGRDLNYGVFVNAGSNASSFKVTFGSEVTRIPARLFATAREKGNNTYARVTNVVVPESVQEIGNNAFYNCYELKLIVINGNDTAMGENCILNISGEGKVQCYYGSKADTYAKNHSIAISYLKPKTPTLSRVSCDENGIKVEWTQAVGAAGYYIYRNTGSGTYECVGKVKTPTTLSYVDTSVASGKSYQYVVRAFATDDNVSDESNSGRAYYLKKVRIKSVQNKANSVQIKWEKVGGASGYTVYRKTGAAGKYKKLKDITSASTVSYTDKSAATGKTYYYKIVANAKDGGVKYTSLDTVVKHVYLKRHSIASVKNDASKTMTVKWKKAASVSGYEVQYSTKSNFSNAVSSKISGGSKVSKKITGLKKGKTYYVRIRTFKSVSGKKYYSDWSASKKVKISK